MIYLLNIKVYRSKFDVNVICFNIIDTVKQPLDYCIEQIHPQQREYYENSESFHLRLVDDSQ